MDVVTKNALDQLQSIIGEGNAARGFHDEGDRLRDEELDGGRHAHSNLRNYQITKLALIGTEVTEAIEELRNGRGADEQYYSGPMGIGVASELVAHELEPLDWSKKPRKPEGAPSELADIVIRAFDFADEENFSLAAVIAEKLAYNDTRGFRHGGKEV